MFPVVINQIDQISVYDIHTFSDTSCLCAASSLAHKCGAVSEPGTPALLLFCSCQLVAVKDGVVLTGSSADLCQRPSPSPCGCSYEWRQPVRADGPDDVLTAINMANNR